MNDITLKLDPDGKGSFFIDQEGERLAEMVISITGNNLTVFHTQVSEKLKGQGVASKLLSAMVAYAREHQLKVIALCPYVAAQFKRHPEQYNDIWNQHWHSNV
jgi:predicted GNAT family acetyltransferase